jgi:hypothetical protein
MNKKKIKKLIKIIDPEPSCGCGRYVTYYVNDKTGTLYDLLGEKISEFIPASRDSLDYSAHDFGCPWSMWAMREKARRRS